MKTVKVGQIWAFEGPTYNDRVDSLYRLLVVEKVNGDICTMRALHNSSNGKGNMMWKNNVKAYGTYIKNLEKWDHK